MKIDWSWVKDSLIKLEKIPHPKSASPNLEILQCVDECLAEAELLSKPKKVLRKIKITGIDNNQIKLADGAVFSSKYVASSLKDAQGLCLFLVTIGASLEKKASCLMKDGESLRGYLLDRIGSMAVESLAQRVEDELRKDYARLDKSVSMRFSPGYCDWKIEEQLKLDKIIDFKKAGVRLTDACMMAPKKSITAIVGIGPKNTFSEIKSQCNFCDKKDCDYRRVFKRY